MINKTFNLFSLWASTHWIWWFVRKHRSPLISKQMLHCKVLRKVVLYHVTKSFAASHSEQWELQRSNRNRILHYFKWTDSSHSLKTQCINPVYHHLCFSSMYAPKLMINLWPLVATKPVGNALWCLCNHYNPRDFRAELLLDLAFLSLQLQQHQTASDCVKELRATDVTVRLRVPSQSASFLVLLSLWLRGLVLFSWRSVSVWWWSVCSVSWSWTNTERECRITPDPVWRCCFCYIHLLSKHSLPQEHTQCFF